MGGNAGAIGQIYGIAYAGDFCRIGTVTLNQQKRVESERDQYWPATVVRAFSSPSARSSSGTPADYSHN